MKKSTKEKIILLLAAGVSLSLTRSPKQYFRIVERSAKAWRSINRAQLYRAIHDFQNHRLIDLTELTDGTIKVVLSEAGKRRILKFNFDAIELPAAEKWDRFWRGIFYDIPNKQRAKRDALRSKLKELGLIEWQKSVFVYPFSCRNQMDFIIEFLEIRPYVRYAEFRNPTNEAELKIKFKDLLKL